MTIAWTTFTPWASLAGGLLVGLAASIFILGSGRIAGVAGVVGGALQGALHRVPIGRDAVRWAFIAGLIVSAWLWSLFAPLPKASIDVGPIGIVAAGLLVGIGVRMGNGCTSGHGVCGLSRLSLRSLVNVLAFMGAGVVTVFLLRHVLGAP